ncbi:FAD-dependent oxidoreductase [Halalkalicoccus tibetensis]|uniref:NAD(P)/FAD-dependent oxidoreductase n=1 Tax=Halalkalicoccus tibetensis TaxID=175632 RepID=A0ABD5V5A0_9EURY
MSVAIVGAGAVGLTAAHDLARAGEDVVVFERGEVGSGSTGRAAGVLYDAYAEDVDARIGRRAIERFRELSGEGDFRFHETPYLWFAHAGDEHRGGAIREQVPRMQHHGIDAALVGRAELVELAPDLETDDVGVAAVARNAGWTDPATYAELLAGKARSAGVEIRTGTEAVLTEGGGSVRVDGESEPFDAVVVTAGAHTARVVGEAGYDLAMKPYRVQALTTEEGAETPMAYDATEGFYLRPDSGGLLVGDGTEEVESDPDGWDREADKSFVESATARVEARFGREVAVDRSWAGLCTATPDGDPLLGWLSEDLYVATGWQGHGFMRAPAIGETIARELRGGSGIGQFDPTRFSGDEAFPIVEGMAL